LYRPDALFHGPTWQVLRQVESNGNGVARADLGPGGPDPVAAAIDAAWQLAAAWSARSTGWLALPVAAARWSPAGPFPDPHGPIRIELEARAEGDHVHADVSAVDADGRVIFHGEGLRLRAAGRAPADLPWPDATDE
jgi:hypothetical protein